MTSANRCPAPTLDAGELLHGFRVLRVEKITEIRITAYEIEHVKTGAKLLHLHCDDRENLYSIGFRTPPSDSTGVPHILEHSVLAGSKRYPLRDVFNELHRGTLQTFINAFTYPDKTIYPVASQVRADYFNLARVYTDLVLRPRLLKETFCQEGHHLEFSDPENRESELIISGIVFNEMKGVYSSPDSLMYKAVQQHLYPDTTYSFDSGGDPDDIPLLTYEQFRAFHRAYYSPSNARFLLYGDIDTRDHLSFLNEMLAGFERVDVDSKIKSQPRWRKPLTIRGTYPIDKDTSPVKKTAVNVAWLTAENIEYETALLLQITSGMLVGSAAGPLRKALIDSGLGEDLSPITGIEADLKQIAFIVGLRGTEPDKAGSIEELIIHTLKDIAKSGFDRALIEGTLHQVEFSGKEIMRSQYPYGIILMGRAYHTWLYDGDPLATLNFPRAIEEVRRKWKANPELFQDVVAKWFLDNPHRLLSVMEPSTTYQAEREKASKKRMAKLKASLPQKNIEAIKKEAEALKKFQTEPDAPDAAAALPRLSIHDLSRSIETIPTVKKTVEDIPVAMHDIFANGVAYLDLVFDVSDVPEYLQQYLPLLAKLIANMGAAGLDYEEMAKRIVLKTGGVAYYLSAGMTVDGKENWQKLIFSVKALHRNLPDAVHIVSDILAAGDMSNEARMRDLIAERKNDLHSSVIPSGHAFARRSAAQALSLPAHRDEQWHGRTQLKFVNAVADEFDEKKKDLLGKLTYLQNMLFRKGRLYINMTADAEGLSLLRKSITELLGRLPAGGGKGVPSRPAYPAVHAGIAIPAQVSYVAKVLPAPPYADPFSAPMFVLARELSSGYLYKHIRVQGGAYGGMSQYDPASGIFALLSYRDPNIINTL
ncbi:MAG TPA: insulinase family protein, partial [Syntrophales bacterium]|nr:insulinase family protein [Syntrophales bacterium]